MSDSLPVSVQLRLERVCARFEAAWQAARPDDLPPRVEDYLGGAAGPERAALLRELILLDLDYRRRCGENPSAEDYAARFPDDAEAIRTVFADLLTARQVAVASADLNPTGPAETAAGAAAGRQANPSVPGYEILEELGRGAQGVVYKARQTKLGRTVALKMNLSGAHAGADGLARFRTEPKAIARLQHPNIVQIFEVGEQGGLPFFSLEFCAGGSLEKKLGGTPLPPRDAAQFAEKLARAMQVAHEKGVIHRDLKPANVMLAEDGTPKITDFGLAKKLDEAGQTAPGAVMGTPSYMAPEQASGKSKALGPACDIYALGAILYECLTGRPPFRGPTMAQTLAQVQTQEPIPPSQFQAAVSADLERVCLRCLEKAPAERYASAAQLAYDLDCCARGLSPLHARPEGLLRTLHRVFSRPRHITEYTPVGLQLHYALGFVIAASHLAVALLLWAGGPELLVWAALFGWYVPLFGSFLANQVRRGAERLLWAIWLGHAAAFAAVCLGNRLTVVPGDWPAAVRASYPALAALSGMALLAMGSTFWTRHYLFGAAWLLTAVVMPLTPEWAPLEAAVVGGGITLLISLYLRRQTREMDAGGRNTTSGRASGGHD
jgi:tRNA A-37 threonylcarbamoyl transferase component Bud32